MFFRHTLILIVFLFYSGLLKSQSTDIQQFTISDDLAYSEVSAIVEDNLGRIWIATMGGGINAYDGESFKSYNKSDGLPSNLVYSIEIDSENLVWVMTQNGVATIQNDKITQIPLDKSNDLRLTSLAIKDFKDEVYIASNENGLWSYKKESKEFHFIPSDTEVFGINKMVEGHDGLLYLMKYRDQIYTIKGGSIKEVFPRDFLANKALFDLGFDLENNAWIATNEGIIITNKPGLQKKINSFLDDNELVRGVYSVLIKQDFTLLGISNGLLKIKNGNIEWINTQGLNSLPPIFDITEDFQGNFWLASQGQGIFKLKFDQLSYFDLPYQKEELVFSVLPLGSERYLAGTSRGYIYELSSRGFSTFFHESKSREITSLLEAEDGNIWAGIWRGGLLRINRNGQLVDDLSLELPISVRTLYQEDGLLWIGGSGHFSSLGGKEIQHFYTEAGRPVRGFQKTKNGNLLVASEDGLYELDNYSNLKKVEEVKSEVTGIVALGDSVWLSTFEDGILVKKESAFEKFKLEKYSPIYGITTDNNNCMVTITGKGIFWVPLDKSNIRYTPFRKGYFPIKSSVFKDKEGNILIGTNKGIIKIPYSYKPVDTVKPRFFIQSVKVNEQVLNSTSYNRFKYNQNSLTFLFQSVNYNQDLPERRFRYKLDGIDNDQSELVETKEVSYKNLPPGEYSFFVTEYNFRQEPINTAGFSFEIAKPFWTTLWFYFFIFVIIISITVFLYRIRIRTILAKEKELEGIRNEERLKIQSSMADDFHDELGNKLANIIAYSSYLEMNLTDVDGQIKSAIKKITSNSQHLFQGTKDFIWTLHSTSSNIQGVIQYLITFGHNFFKDTGIVFKTEINSADNPEIPSGYNRQIILICKEVMTNCFKHSKAKNLLFSVTISEKIEISIKDDGTGLKEKNRNGIGLQSIKKRAEKIGSELFINSSEKGTKVELKIPISQKKN